jgi:predicted  nucleic acid-binding Zn-ribbon protein
MVSNQTEFSNTYSKEITEIRFKNKDFIEKQLVIEDYPNLETLYLRGIDSLDKLILRNLKQLQKCTISGCGVQELVIENCSQVKELKTDDNSLTNLEFLKNLPNLQKLNIDDNAELASGLEHLPKGTKFSCENTKLNYQEEDLRQKYENLKGVITSLAKETQKELVGKLDQEIKEKEEASEQPKTQELVSNLKNSVKGLKEVKKELETNLTESEKKIQKLEEELAEAKTRSEERQKKIEELSQEHTLEEITYQAPLHEKTIAFLRAKSIFLNARQETIGELKKCFIALENKFGKHEIIGKVSNMISGAGGVFDTVTFGVPRAIGEVIKAGNNFARINLIDRGNKEFQLSLKDEQELIQLHHDYDSLINLVHNNEELKNESDINILNLKDRTRDCKACAFNTNYEIFSILESKNV